MSSPLRRARSRPLRVPIGARGFRERLFVLLKRLRVSHSALEVQAAFPPENFLNPIPRRNSEIYENTH